MSRVWKPSFREELVFRCRRPQPLVPRLSLRSHSIAGGAGETVVIPETVDPMRPRPAGRRGIGPGHQR